MHVGKYMNQYNVAMSQQGYPAPPPGWNEFFTLIEPAHAYYNFKIFDGSGIRLYGTSSADYQTDVLTRQALKYLQQEVAGDRPFYLRIDYLAPHEDLVTGQHHPIPAPRHLGLMNGVPLPTPPSFNESDVSDKPIGIRSRPLMNSSDIADLTNDYHWRAESLLAVDEGVAEIIQKLRDKGEYDDTIFVFTSDNGYLMGEHRVPGAKFLPYEPTRVPLFVMGTGIPAGQSIHSLVVNVDLPSTIMDWAHGSVGLPQDGRSLVPLIDNPGIAWRRDVLIENPLSNYYTGLYVRQPNGDMYHYVEYDYDPDGPTGPGVPDGVWDERELYKLSAALDSCLAAGDAYELESQHNNSCYGVLLQRFHDRLVELKACAGRSCN
jgi:hypothetical protein